MNFNANLIVWEELQRKRSKHRKTLGIKLLMLWKNKRDIDSRFFFTVNRILEKWGMCLWKSLKSSWILLEFFVKKRVRTLELLYWWAGNPFRTGCGSCSGVIRSSDRVAFLVHVFFWIQVCASIFINFIFILPFRVRSASPWGWRELVNFVFVDFSCLQQLQGWPFYLYKGCITYFGVLMSSIGMHFNQNPVNEKPLHYNVVVFISGCLVLLNLDDRNMLLI